MVVKTKLKVPLNRVEGDLEIKADLEDNLVTRAWSSGTMFRGIENIMVGRNALDGLVITPRICGICSTAHLTAATLALEDAAKITPPRNALILRNLALMAELLQSDMRQTCLSFMVDATNRAYAERPFYAEALARYAPLKGETTRSVIQASRKLLEVVAVIGGQWPHSSYMVPGGVTTIPQATDIQHCRLVLREFRNWYEERILGCSLERWQEVESLDDLDKWLQEQDSHRRSELGFFIDFARQVGLDECGHGVDRFLTYGLLPLPEGQAWDDRSRSTTFIPAGVAQGDRIMPFNQRQVEEHLACSWYNYVKGGQHPFEGVTQPYAAGEEGRQYSWAKAPRYEGLPAETGPVAEMLVLGQPLFQDALQEGRVSAFVRQLARVVRGALFLPLMEEWLEGLDRKDKCYVNHDRIWEGDGIGLTGGARGALGHWVKIREGVITNYQVITPTGWNGSPRDDQDTPGPWEQALEGTRVQDPDNPIELGHIVRSFDPCLVCTVHAVERKSRT